MNKPEKIRAESEVLAKVELKKIGNSTGVILPKELMTRLKLNTGDQLHVTVTAEGGIQFTPYDPKFAKAMTAARRGMKLYRNALAELAK